VICFLMRRTIVSETRPRRPTLPSMEVILSEAAGQVNT
jgi:hypothetical protein